jgi:hypothetical protein
MIEDLVQPRDLVACTDPHYLSRDNFGVQIQIFWNDSSVSCTFCSTHNSRIKSEVFTFIFINRRIRLFFGSYLFDAL